MKKYHQYKNENPLKKETGDCVVRALATATGEAWDDVYRELFKIGYELKVMPNNQEAYEAFLISRGFKKNKISNKKGSKRPTVLEFTKNHKTGSHILRVANHVVACVDGVYYDIWDCGDKSLYGYWSLEE